MRVAIVCAGGILSGKEAMVLQLADGLRAADMDVRVIRSRWTDGRFAEQLAKLAIPSEELWFGFISAQLKLKPLLMTFDQLLRWSKLLGGYRNFLNSFRPDCVIHTNWHSLLLISPFLRSDRDVYWIHEVIPNKRAYRAVFHWLARRLAGFIAVSEAVATALRKVGLPAAKLSVVHNGIAISRSTVAETPRSPNNTVGIVGQIGEWKGHEDLLRAFQIVVEAQPALILKVYGSGAPDYEAFLRRRVDELGMGRNIEWRGYSEDRDRMYRDISVLAVPSRSEDPLPTVAIEASFYEIPVVASARGGLVEIVEHGVTGFLFPAGDIQSLAAYLLELFADADLRRRMGRNARDRAEQLFNRDRFIRRFTFEIDKLARA